jgi:uncharacterized protein YqeY
MTLKTKISDDLKNAMRAGEAGKRDTLRLLQAAIKQREVDERIELDDAAVLAAIEKMLKQRRESITQFEAAGRTDLADKEKFESGILQTYLPASLSEAEIGKIVDAAVQSTAAASVKDMGKVVAVVKPQVAGRADMAQVSALIKARLGA